MSPLLVIVGVLFGAIFGSFATVLQARIPGAESIGGRSACRSCGVQLRAVDNIPLLSWCLLRGRCRACGAPIGWVYPITELLTVAAFLIVLAQEWPVPLTLAWLWFAPLAVALVFIDLRHLRLPNALTWSAFGGALLLLGIQAAWAGDPASLRSAVFGAFGLSAFYLLLNIVSRGGMGMGDVKLALAIGALHGYLGWIYVVTATFLAFIAGSAVGVTLMVMRRAGRKTALPFGPFMIFGTFAALLVTDPALEYLLFG